MTTPPPSKEKHNHYLTTAAIIILFLLLGSAFFWAYGKINDLEGKNGLLEARIDVLSNALNNQSIQFNDFKSNVSNQLSILRNQIRILNYSNQENRLYILKLNSSLSNLRYLFLTNNATVFNTINHTQLELNNLSIVVNNQSKLITTLNYSIIHIQLIPGPKGDKGDKGDSVKGDTGSQGQNGKDGDTWILVGTFASNTTITIDKTEIKATWYSTGSITLSGIVNEQLHGSGTKSWDCPVGKLKIAFHGCWVTIWKR